MSKSVLTIGKEREPEPALDSLQKRKAAAKKEAAKKKKPATD